MDLDEINKDLLIIFTRNIELGKCKTRLARRIGPEKALEIYRFLVKHTAEISRELAADKWVFYSEYPEQEDLFENHIYEKYKQEGADLGTRMDKAFSKGFEKGYSRIVIIGSDIYDLDGNDLKSAFNSLEDHDYVIGPAQDGGYYLLGMKERNTQVFKNKPWGTENVLQQTMNDLRDGTFRLLDMRNDVDVYEDIVDVPEFQRFLSN